MHTTRPATAADLPALRAVYLAATAGPAFAVARGQPCTDWEAGLAEETQLVCCTPDGAVCSFVSVYRPEAFIHHLYVAPAFQRRGVATALLAALADVLAPPWQLKCLLANTDALRFYQRAGWLEVQRDAGPDGPFALLRLDTAAGVGLNRG